MDLYEESRHLAVVGKAQRLMHKNSSGASQYTLVLQNVYFRVNERCILRIFSCFNGRMLQICKPGQTFSMTISNVFFYIDSIFKGWQFTLHRSQNIEYY